MAMNLRTPIGILSFPVLFTPKPVVPGGEPRYSVNLLLNPTQQNTPELAAMKQAVVQTIDEKWGAGKARDRDFIKKLTLPFLRCEDQKYDGYQIPGGVFIRPWTKNRPGIVDANRQEITVPGDVWAGQMVRLTVSPFAYAQTGNLGISFALNNVQVCRTDGRRLDGRRAAPDDFDNYSDPSAPAMADEDIPF
jgi:Enterobacter phage Enc34, ssDNA-binding protein